MEKIELNAATRDMNQSPASIRKAGRIPGVLYGHGVANMHTTVVLGEFEKVLRKAGESTVISLKVEGEATHPVLIQDVHRHYLTGRPIHVDFYQVNLKEKVKSTIPLEFVGTSAAVKSLNGVLVKAKTEVDVEALPTDLPHSLSVDISAIETFDKHLTVADIVLPSGVHMITPSDVMIAKVQPPRNVEAELTPVVEDVSKVEVIKPVKETEESGK